MSDDKDEAPKPDNYYGDDPYTHPDPERWWTNRRKAMFFSQKWGVVQTLLWAILAYFNPEAVTASYMVIAGSYGLTALPIIGYYSNTAVQEYARGLKFK